jgi:hypothetical protein
MENLCGYALKRVTGTTSATFGMLAPSTQQLALRYCRRSMQVEEQSLEYN